MNSGSLFEDAVQLLRL